jgi:hypothetical protein
VSITTSKGFISSQRDDRIEAKTLRSPDRALVLGICDRIQAVNSQMHPCASPENPNGIPHRQCLAS